MRGLKYILAVVLLINSMLLFAQEKSIHQEQAEYYKQFDFKSEKQYDDVFGTKHLGAPKQTERRACNLEYDVYGWHPYWVGTAYQDYDYSLLSTFSYFSYELNPSTGSYTSIHSWKTSPSIDMALAAGCRVELCVTNFGSSNNNTFLTNATARQTLIDSLISLVNYRNAHGVNIDFEGISGSNRNDFTSFMQDLSVQLKAAIPGATVTMALYSVDWNSVFDIPALDPYVDKMIVMGYGYYYSGSSKAGPTDPLYSGVSFSSLNLIRTINYYLNEGITPSKLVMGLPYYGYEWETVDNSIPSSTTGNFSSSRTYAYIRNNSSGNYSNKQINEENFTPYYVYQTGGAWRQAWVDDEWALGRRYDEIKRKGIGGIGIWALGYDNGYTELWDLLRDKLSSCAFDNCTDSIYDMGGPYGNHYDNEAYTFTVAPPNATSLDFDFTAFELESGYDSLWLYDGASTSDPLIGAYSGTTGPGTFTTSTNAITFKFYSDGATKKLGWKAYYNCNLAVPPATPQAFCVLNESATSVRVKVAVDPDADGYEVYLSTDGTTFTGPDLYTGNDFVVTGLTSDQIVYVKLKAYNADGSSDFTEVLAAIPSATVDNVLIVNGFDRGVTGNTYDFIRQHGSAVENYGYKFSSASNEAITEGIVALTDYEIVDYILGEESTVDETFSDSEQTLVKTYLDQGGKLFVTGAEIAWDLDNKGSSTDKDFYNNYLKASYVDDAPNGQSATYYEVTDIAGDIFDGLGNVSFDDGSNGTYDVNWPDVITVTSGADLCMEYTNVTAQYAGVKYEGTFPGGATTGKLVNLGVPFETFYPETGRNAIMTDVLDFFLDPIVPPTASVDITYCDGASLANVSATANSGGTLTWYSDAALTTSIGTGTSITPSNAVGTTTYYVTETVLTQESEADSVKVTIYELPSITESSITVTATDCGLTNGSVTGIMASGTGSLTYSWQNANNVEIGTAVDLTGVGAGVYHLVVSDDNCSNTSSDFNVTEIGAPAVPTVTGVGTYCAGDVIGSLSASGGAGTLTWYSDAGLTSVLTTGTTYAPGNITTTTSYYVTETQGGCESAADMATITVNPLPVADAGNDITICAGESAQLTATGGITYNWDNSLGAGSTHTVSPSSTTTYSVTVSENGCSAIDEVVVSVTAKPVANAGNDIAICAGESVVLSASGGSTYVWDNGLGSGNNFSATPTVNTTYTVTVTQNNCSSIDAINVTVNSVPVASAGNDETVCAGDQVLLLASGGNSYVWDNGLGTGSSHNITVNATTTYTVTVTTGSCSATDEVTISVTPLPTADAGTNQAICNGEPVTLTASGGISYTWDNGLGSGQQQVVTPLSNTSYSVTVSDGTCIASDMVNITVHDQPVINTSSISVTPQDCGLTNGAISGITAIGSGSLNYQWHNTAGITVGSAIDLTNVNSGDYTLLVTDDYCVDSTAYIAIGEINPAIPSISGVSNYCAGVSIGDLTSTVGSGTITWYSDAALNISITTGTVLSPGNITTTTTYYATETQGGCESSAASATITITPSPLANAGSDKEICDGDFTVLVASGGGTYFWSHGLGVGMAQNASPSSTTTYTVTVTVDGCSATDEVTVSVTPPPVADFTTSETVNYDPDFDVSFTNLSTGATSYSWNFGDGSTSTDEHPTHTYGATGTYSITLTAGNGVCDDVVKVKTNYLSILPTTVTPVTPTADFSIVSVELCSGDSLELINTSQDADSYQWIIADGTGWSATSTAMNPSFGISTTDVYSITLTATNAQGSDVMTQSQAVVVSSGAVASFDVSDTLVVPSDVVTFTNQSTGGIDHCWDFDNGSITCSNNAEVYYLYTAIGDYHVSLVAIDQECGNDTAWQMIHVVDPSSLQPVAAFELSRTRVCEGDTFTVMNTSAYSSTYRWESNGSLPDNPNAFEPVFTATVDGNVIVTLTVNAGAAMDTASLLVDPLPNADFYASDTVIDVNTNGVIGFYNYSSESDSYLWSFGDGSTSVLATPWNQYQQVGLYDVSLVATNACGTDTLTKEDYIEVIYISGVQVYNMVPMKVYPNPVIDVLTVETGTDESRTVRIENALGQVVYEQVISNYTVIDRNQLGDAGIYFVKVLGSGVLIGVEQLVVVN